MNLRILQWSMGTLWCFGACPVGIFLHLFTSFYQFDSLWPSDDSGSPPVPRYLQTAARFRQLPTSFCTSRRGRGGSGKKHQEPKPKDFFRLSTKLKKNVSANLLSLSGVHRLSCSGSRMKCVLLLFWLLFAKSDVDNKMQLGMLGYFSYFHFW